MQQTPLCLADFCDSGQGLDWLMTTPLRVGIQVRQVGTAATYTPVCMYVLRNGWMYYYLHHLTKNVLSSKMETLNNQEQM